MVTRELEAFVRAALPAPPARVLEIGAGKGELAVALSDAGYAMTAVDPAAEPGGIVQSRSLLDVRAIRWWISQRQALGIDEHEHEPSDILAHLREHIHPLERMLAALEPHFDLGPPVPGPYLHRWELRSSLYDAEVDLIAAGLLPAVGCRLIAVRR